MLKPPVSISMAFVRGMLSGVQARGLSYEPFLQQAGIDPSLLQQAGARVTAEQYANLFRTLVHQLRDDGLGFFSRGMKNGSFLLIVRSALAAPTLEVAMRRMARTFWLLQDDVEVIPVRDGQLSGWALHFSDNGNPHVPFMHEMLLRIFWRILAWLVGGRLPTARFDFAFERPPYAASYAKVVPGELRFEQPHSAFWFDADRLRDPIRRDEAALRAFTDELQTNIIVPRRRDQEASTRVRMHLQKSCPEWPDVASAAQALHMSVSTLQRNLGSEGTSFQILKDELRRDMAITRLYTTTVPLAALAAELGFSDSAAFQRAFKSWTGSPPGAYRQRGLGCAAPSFNGAVPPRAH